MIAKKSDRPLVFQSLLLSLIMLSSIVSCITLESTPREVNIEFPNDPRVDKSFISGQPCKAPCWYGLELGRSSVEDIQTTLLALAFIDSASIGTQKFSSDPEELLFFADCVYSEPKKDCVLLETSPEGQLRKITLEVYYALTLKSAIEQLGTPGYYVSDPISGKDACTVHVYWPNASVIALWEATPKEKYCVGEKSNKINLGDQIEQIIYTVIEAQQDGIPWIEVQ